MEKNHCPGAFPTDFTKESLLIQICESIRKVQILKTSRTACVGLFAPAGQGLLGLRQRSPGESM